MSLKDELESICYKMDFSLPNGTSKTIEEFFDVVVKPTMLGITYF